MTAPLVALLIVVALAAIVSWRSMGRPLARSSSEVAAILKEFVAGEPTGHGADDFIHTPIADRRLEAIRAEFGRLVDGLVRWEPQAPFPPPALPALRALIDRAEAFARETDAALREFGRWTRQGQHWNGPPDKIGVPISLGPGTARPDDEMLTVAVSAVDRFRQLETKARSFIDARNASFRVGDVIVLEVVKLTNPWAFTPIPSEAADAFGAGEPAVILTFAIVDDRDVVDVVFWNDDAVGWDAH